MSPTDNVVLHPLGFYQLRTVPTPAELETYYAQKYYQEEKGNYAHAYPDDERAYFSHKIEQKDRVIREIWGDSAPGVPSLVDVGCGEGFALKFYGDKGWDVLGLDYSSFGCEQMNPDCVDRLQTGDVSANLNALFTEQRTFDVIWLSNVLEHVPDPVELLQQCHALAHDKTVMVVMVPNDFSVLQQYLIEQQKVTRPYWVAIPDHISYFNRDSLIRLGEHTGWHTHRLLTDFPIDWFLLNDSANYIADRSRGRTAHRSRVELENLMHQISPDQTNHFYEAMATLGLGRQLIAFFGKGNSQAKGLSA